MAVVFVQGKTNFSASTTTGTVTLGAAPTSGNVLVAFVLHSTSSQPSAAPSGTGWSARVGSTTAGGSARACVIYWKIAGVGESATITMTGLTASWSMTVVEYSGVDAVSTVNGGPLTNLPTAAASFTSASVTTTAVAGLVVVFGTERSVTSTTAWSAHAFAGSTTGVTARVNNNLNNQSGTSGLATAWDFIGTLPASANTATVTTPASDAGATGIVAFNAAAVAGGSPVFVPSMGVRRRSIRRAIPRINPGSWVPPVVAPPPSPLAGFSRGSRRRPKPGVNRRSPLVPSNVHGLGLRLRGGTTFGLRTGDDLRGGIVTVSNPIYPFDLARRVRLPLGRARARSITPLPVQVIVTGAPAITQTTTARIRRALASYRRRAAPGAPVAAQDELPGPTTRRRLPIMSARRRASASFAAFQDPLPRAAGRRRAAAVRPRPKVVAPVPPQFNPPIVQTVFGRLRTVGRVRPRTKVVSPTQAQQSLTPNPAITATVFGRLRTVGRIRPRTKVSTTVPPQFNPPIVQTVFGRLRTVGRIRPRTKVASPTQAQQSLTPNPVITATVFGRLRTVGRVRPSARVRIPVPAQPDVTPNPNFGRLRAIGRIRPRTKVAAPVPPQFNPPIVQTVFGRLRTVGRIRPRAKVASPTQAQQPLTPNPAITATVFGRLRAAGRVRPRTKAVTPVPPQFNPPIVQTVFGRLRIVGRVKPRTKAVTPVAGQTVTPNPAITATVFGRLRTVGRIKPRTKAVTPVPLQDNVRNPAFGRLRSKGRTNRIPRTSRPIPPQANPLYPIRPSVGGLSGLRRVWLKIRRKNAYPVPGQITTLQGPLTITDSHGGVEADRGSGIVISGTYGSSSISTVSSGSSGGFTADPDADNVAPTYDSDSDSL